MKPKPDSRPKYWRSLSELEGDPEFHEFVEREFRSPVEQEAPTAAGRRRFMQIMGASFALTGCYWKEEKLLPHTKQPEGFVPGEPVHYATHMELAGDPVGLWVKSYDGRPIKVEGNPNDSVSLGGTGVAHQAAILGFYDPDRSSKPLQRGEATSSEAFDQALLLAFRAAAKKGGQGFAVLSRATRSPSLLRLKAELKKQAPEATWTTYEAGYCAGPDKGAELAFGHKATMRYSVEKADVIVALDSEFIESGSPGALGSVRSLASRRDPDVGEMSRIYALETRLSEIGSLADHRVAVTASAIPALVALLDARISAARGEAGAQAAPSDNALGGAEAKKVIEVAAKDLLEHAGQSLVVVGAKHAPEVHAVVHRINVLLGNVGTTLTYLEPAESINGGADDLAALVAEMEGNKVETLLILGANAAYDSAADIEFKAALSKVKQSFHIGLYVDETAELASFHAPEAHFLEAWSDSRALDGTLRIGQPLIDPILNGRTYVEHLARFLGLPETSGQAIVRKTLGLRADKDWQSAVHDGFLGQPSKSLEVKLQTIAPIALPQAVELEVIFDLCPKVHDGRFANNGWLQELPHSLSKLTWGNAALVSPVTQKKYGLKDGFRCKVTVDGRSIDLPLMIAPGQADGTVGVVLGYGREAAGVVGGSKKEETDIIGSDTYKIRPSKAPHFASGAIALIDAREDLGITQDLHAIDDIGRKGQKDREDQLIREATVAEYRKHPSVIEHKVHHPPLLSLWQPPVSYDGHKWGLAVDLNKCGGCNACVIACQSENNISVVGKKEIARGREMSWIRIERYYKGDENSPAVRQQPVMCQQCENAPCEQVCPVGATMHSKEGLNDMVYTRCIGTRYCSNNCPYKVRRFNYRNYNLEAYGITPYTGTDEPRAKLKAMAFNPEVTVRSRGVMEKCTFCVQRIQNVKIKAKNHKRAIVDGEIKVACEQACASGALVFGDLNDKQGRVGKAHSVPRAYELLQELNNRPRVNYLARISNPHPELSTQDGHAEHH